MRARFNERPCLKRRGGKRLKKTADGDLWPPKVTANTHAHYTRVDTHKKEMGKDSSQIHLHLKEKKFTSFGRAFGL